MSPTMAMAKINMHLLYGFMDYGFKFMDFDQMLPTSRSVYLMRFTPRVFALLISDSGTGSMYAIVRRLGVSFLWFNRRVTRSGLSHTTNSISAEIYPPQLSIKQWRHDEVTNGY